MSPHLGLNGMRVMVVEDELLIALLVEDALEQLGCLVIGPFATLAKAMAAAREESVDLAVLDVNLAGEKVYPVADLLASRAIPFIFLSGYGKNAVPANRAHWRVCAKPFSIAQLSTALTSLVAEHAVRSAQPS